MIAYTGLDHVQLAAPPGCEAAARAFYGELLGLPEVPKPADMAARGGCWFQCGPQQVHIGVEAEFAPARKAHPGILLADPASFEALAARFWDIWDGKNASGLVRTGVWFENDDDLPPVG